MNIPPSSAAASIAGTIHASAKGGELDQQGAEATRRQGVAESPAGQRSDTAEVGAGEQTDDRGGNGREFYDRFERQADGESNREATSDADHAEAPASWPPQLETGEHLDFQA